MIKIHIKNISIIHQFKMPYVNNYQLYLLQTIKMLAPKFDLYKLIDFFKKAKNRVTVALKDNEEETLGINWLENIAK